MADSADPDQPTDLDLHCLQRQDISRLSRTRVKVNIGLDKSGFQINILLISPQKHMLWVLIRSATPDTRNVSSGSYANTVATLHIRPKKKNIMFPIS